MESIEKFLAVGYGYGYGYGNGYGNGKGNGYGYGDGYGNGYGYGDGYGYGYGNGYGNGKGYGDGYGYGDGNGYGGGNGYGDGYGNGDGDGNGGGYGYGYGYGNGYGGGNGYGDGYGNGIAKFNGHDVHVIDGVHTCLTSVHGNYAKGFTIKKNSIKVSCYVAKVGDCFAHGETLEQARADAQAKYDRNRPVEERIADFMAKYPTLDTIASNRDLFTAHNILTGSCLFGRQQFVERHGIDLDGSMSVAQFIWYTSNEYGGDTIKMLMDEYNKAMYGKEK